MTGDTINICRMGTWDVNSLVGIREVEILPELEVGVDHPVGETFTANTDAFKHTVTGQLVHHKVRVDETCATKLHTAQEKPYNFLRDRESNIFWEKNVQQISKVKNSCKVLTGLLQLVGDDTTYEVRLGRPQGVHQVVKLFL